MWPGHMNGFGWGGFLIGGLVMLLFWGGVIALAFFAIRGILTSGKGASDPAETDSGRALQILKECYARGEIDQEEFQRIKADLKD